MWHSLFCCCLLLAAPLPAEDPATVAPGGAPRPAERRPADRPAAEDRVEPASGEDWSRRISLAGGALVVLYFAAAWLLVGRRPWLTQGVLRTEPPDDLSPAAAAYLAHLGFTRHAVRAALASLVARGAIGWQHDQHANLLTLADQPSQPLPAEERRMLEALFPGERRVVDLSRPGRKALLRAGRKLKRALERSYRSAWLQSHDWLWGGGALAAGAVLLAALWAGPWDKLLVTAFFCVWLSGWTIGTGLLVALAALSWAAVVLGRKARMRIGTPRGKSRPLGRLGSLAVAVFMTLFAVPFVVGEVMAIGVVYEQGQPLVVGVGAVLLVAVIAARLALRSRTAEGEERLRELTGFRRYLAAGPFGAAPRGDLHLYQKYLPYAVALGVAEAWAAQFPGATAAGPPGTLTPTW